MHTGGTRNVPVTARQNELLLTPLTTDDENAIAVTFSSVKCILIFVFNFSLANGFGAPCTFGHAKTTAVLLERGAVFDSDVSLRPVGQL